MNERLKKMVDEAMRIAAYALATGAERSADLVLRVLCGGPSEKLRTQEIGYAIASRACDELERRIKATPEGRARWEEIEREADLLKGASPLGGTEP